MKTWFRRVVQVFASLVALWIVLQPWLASASHDANHVVVQITDAGFNGKEGPIIEVEQGQMIELTFQWAHKSQLGEQHIVVLDGYRLETDRLDSAHRESTLKFIADKAGTFNFKCDLECDLHDHLQRGYIKVKPAGSAAGGNPAAARTETALSLRPSTPVIAGGESINLMVTLRDTKDAPVAKADVHFFVDAEFVGTKDEMAIGTARTDANGVAFFDYRPAMKTPVVRILAHFDGMGVYAESEQTVEVQVAGVAPSAYKAELAGLDAIRAFAPLALVAIVLGIWSVYGFVLIQIAGILRERERR